MSRSSFNASFLGHTVSICRDEYQELVKTAQQYENLCRNLLDGGVGEEALELLSSKTAANANSRNESDESWPITAANGIPEEVKTLADDGSAVRLRSGNNVDPRGFVPYSHANQGSYTGGGSILHDPTSDGNSSEDFESDSTETEKASLVQEHGLVSGPKYEKVATRTVQLLNLAPGTTFADITSVVRGGFLVDIFLRARDSTVALSFLYASDAQAFYQYVQLNGLQIKGTEVGIKWNDRQFVLAGHTAHKIGLGACRNLIIRHCNPNHTEQSITEDLDHIHILAVIQIQFIGGHCFISTNSVNAAMFARTCMMSRIKYRGSRIEWGVDECAQPLHKIPIRRTRQAEPPSTQGSVRNRFELLSLE